MGKKSGFESGMNNPYHISKILETIYFWVKILKFFGENPRPGSGIFFEIGSGIWDGKNSDPG
jgi:hypothetical protein